MGLYVGIELLDKEFLIRTIRNGGRFKRILVPSTPANVEILLKFREE
jgi:hypothetical protein